MFIYAFEKQNWRDGSVKTEKRKKERQRQTDTPHQASW